MIKFDFEGFFRTLVLNEDKATLPTSPVDDICREYKTDRKRTEFALGLVTQAIFWNSDLVSSLTGNKRRKDADKVLEAVVGYTNSFSSDPFFKALMRAQLSFVMPLFDDASLSQKNPKTGNSFWKELALLVMSSKGKDTTPLLPEYGTVWKKDEDGNDIITYEKIA